MLINILNMLDCMQIFIRFLRNIIVFLTLFFISISVLFVMLIFMLITWLHFQILRCFYKRKEGNHFYKTQTSENKHENEMKVVGSNEDE